jgi:hypothetical protein
MNQDDEKHSFGVFKPVGHVVISFPTAEHAAAAAQALAEGGGTAAADVHAYTDQQMVQQIDHDLAQASPLASIGQEVNLVKAHRELALKGYHWLVVRADDEQAARVAEVARSHGAERAQLYGRFIIEELIDRPGDLAQVAESPDRGLDAQTPSGRETDAAELQPADAPARQPAPPPGDA